MSNQRIAASFFVSALLLASTVGSAQEPVAPKGYSWQKCVGMKARFLKPERWHFREEGDEKGGTACFLSLESIATGGEYVTGVAINYLPRVEQRTGAPVAEYAQRFVDEMVARSELIQRGGSEQHGLFLRHAEVRSVDPGKPKIRMHAIVIANPSTGSVYIIVFETLAELWDTWWPVAKPIVEQLGLETEM